MAQALRKPNVFDEAVVRIEMQRNNMLEVGMEDLFEYLRKLDLPSRDYAIFGSGPLIIRGWLHGTNDIDVICRDAAWQSACESGVVSYDERYDVSLASHCNGRLTFGTSWGIGNFDVDELIETAETIDGLRFVQVEHVITYKQIRCSAKDLLHLEQYRRAVAKSET